MFNRKRLIEIMEEKDISAYKLWKLSGVSQSTISDILNKDDKNPTTRTLEKLANALGVPVDEFFKEDDLLNEDNKKNRSTAKLDVVPLEFTDPDEARAYVNKHRIFASEGFDSNKLTDKEILEFANTLLNLMKMASYKYKK